MRLATPEVVVFDLDGTLLDSDDALATAFVRLGVPRSAVTFGHVIAEECRRLGLSLDDYVDAYDTEAAQPFAGVDALLDGLDRWAVCSNKHPSSGHAELARLGWEPELALFADAFDGPKRLDVVLARLGIAASAVLYVGDTAHDREAAAAIGCRFVLAGWNPRAGSRPGDEVAAVPGDVLVACSGQSLGSSSA
jgi:HAD superfamily hydrolase (TIGR01549 family)